MRVLMVLGRFLDGGAERTALELVRALAGDQWAFQVVAVRRTGHALAQEFRQAGAEVREGIAWCRWDLLAPLRLARLLRRHRAEVLVVVDVPRDGMFCAAAATRLTRHAAATVSWCHAAVGGQGGRFDRVLRRHHRWGLLDRVVCVGAEQRDELAACGLPAEVLSVIPNGIDLERFARPQRTDLALPADKRILVQVANVMPDKDHATLIEAADRLARRRSDFHVVLVGRGTDAPAMRRAARRAGVEPQCTLAGPRADVPGVLAAADIFVLSTRRESFGLAVLEAMAVGLPVVVSDLPVLRSLITDGREGLTFPVGDADRLAAALGRLLDAPALRKKMGAAGRRRAQDFSAAQMAARFANLMESLVGGRSAGSRP